MAARAFFGFPQGLRTQSCPTDEQGQPTSGREIRWCHRLPWLLVGRGVVAQISTGELFLERVLKVIGVAQQFMAVEEGVVQDQQHPASSVAVMLTHVRLASLAMTCQAHVVVFASSSYDRTTSWSASAALYWSTVGSVW